MKRRWLISIPTSKVRRGAYATKWQTWAVAWQRILPTERLRRWNRTSIAALDDEDFHERVPDYCGVYAFLNQDGYVLYVGRSIRLGTEILSKYRGFHSYKRNHIEGFVAHAAPNAKQMEYMELDLLWYYTPPWNTRFHK